MGLTNVKINGRAGMAAFLPNQPILHDCIAKLEDDAVLKPGDAVALSAGAEPKNAIVVEPAGDNQPIGVVVYNSIASGFKNLDRVSVFPVNSYVQLPAGEATITRGTALTFNEDGQVVEADGAAFGVAYTEPSAVGDLIAVRIELKVAGADLSGYLTSATAAATYVPLTRTINSKALSADITLTAEDVGAEPAQG